MPPLRISVQSANRLVRDALCGCLALSSDLAVAGQAATPEELATLCSIRHPDVVLVHERLLDLPIVEALARLHSRFPQVEIVLAYAEATGAALVAAIQAGITGLVPVSGGLESLVRHLRQAARAEDRGRHRDTLTEREQRIVSLLGAGRTVPEIATMLRISRYTVENHKRRIYAKLGVGTQCHAVSRAAALGLLAKPVPVEPFRPSGRRASAAVILAHEPPQPALAQAAAALLAGGLAFTLVQDGAGLNAEWQARKEAESVTGVLIDPVAEDWTLARSADIPLVVIYASSLDLSALVDLMPYRPYAMLRSVDVATALCPALHLVSIGYAAMAPALLGDAANWMSGRAQARAAEKLPELTGREHDVLRSIAAGETVRQNARSLGIAAKTVETIQARLFRKLGTHGRSETLTVAYRLGLVDLTVPAPQFGSGGTAIGDPVPAVPIVPAVPGEQVPAEEPQRE